MDDDLPLAAICFDRDDDDDDDEKDHQKPSIYSVYHHHHHDGLCLMMMVVVVFYFWLLFSFVFFIVPRIYNIQSGEYKPLSFYGSQNTILMTMRIMFVMIA